MNHTYASLNPSDSDEMDSLSSTPTFESPPSPARKNQIRELISSYEKQLKETDVFQIPEEVKRRLDRKPSSDSIKNGERHPFSRQSSGESGPKNDDFEGPSPKNEENADLKFFSRQNSADVASNARDMELRNRPVESSENPSTKSDLMRFFRQNLHFTDSKTSENSPKSASKQSSKQNLFENDPKVSENATKCVSKQSSKQNLLENDPKSGEGGSKNPFKHFSRRGSIENDLKSEGSDSVGALKPPESVKSVTDRDYSMEKNKVRAELSRTLTDIRKNYVRRVCSTVRRGKDKELDESPHLFEACLLVELNISTLTPYIKGKYPNNFEVPPWVEHLCYPDATDWSPEILHRISTPQNQTCQCYSLVITNEKGERKFGYCRRVLPEEAAVCLPLTYCIISPFRAPGFYHKVLQELESRHGLPHWLQNAFLRELYNSKFPRPGQTVKISCLLRVLLIDSCEKLTEGDENNFSQNDDKTNRTTATVHSTDKIGHKNESDFELKGDHNKNFEKKLSVKHRNSSDFDLQRLDVDSNRSEASRSSTLGRKRPETEHSGVDQEGNVSKIGQIDLAQNRSELEKNWVVWEQNNFEEYDTEVQKNIYGILNRLRLNKKGFATIDNYVKEFKNNSLRINTGVDRLQSSGSVNVSTSEIYKSDSQTFVDDLDINSCTLMFNLPNSQLIHDCLLGDVVFRRPYDHRIEDTDLTVLFETLNLGVLLQTFGSLLLERKVVFISKCLSQLSSCVEAMQSILYPFSWQHTFIPVLSSNMLDILSAPLPLVAGVLASHLTEEVILEDGIAVNLDNSSVVCSVGDEPGILPKRLRNGLSLALQLVTTSSSIDGSRNVLVSEAFMRMFVEVCGHYKSFIGSNGRHDVSFEKDGFIKHHTSKSAQLFLEWFVETAMFQTFINAQLESSEEDNIFEQRCVELHNEKQKNKGMKKMKNFFKT